ncbi:hypothetical protein A2976_02545 [candidate division WWE3 bacterium RIFCSPLOWO2_01_FULL_41_9]|uniref:Cell division protein FtsL n=3 Tax=Katanobacteria TaxID=422282 RepID=A0A1F4VJK7_UNCKA|nr:MAG: hypothetical protein A2976_02545 [candidate division WWE3 bacterium RIFCSPLOWO2_01_FULL_41_9]
MYPKLPMYSTKRFNSDDILKLGFKLSVVALVLSILSQMFFANKLAVKSSELTELNDRKVVLEKDLAKLEFDNSVLSSLMNIEQRALQLGFVPMTGTILAIRPAPTVSAVNIPSL